MADELQSNLDFRVMALLFRIRDFFFPRMHVLKEVGIKPGFQVLDYGCGPGSHILPVEELIGQTGKVHALDIHPLAIQMVRGLVSRRGLTNVETILSDRETGLPDGSIDAVLFYDILHALSEPDRVLAELHRVLKPDGVLSVSDHHLRKSDIVGRVTANGLFRLSQKGERTCSFARTEA